MSKIICDVCGTSYPESATQCPICGCVRPADVNTVLTGSDELNTRTNGNYNYVKGGRFSKANVKKRNKEKVYDESESVAKTEKHVDENPQKKKKSFWITISILIIAILAVAIYIVLRFFDPFAEPNTESTQGSTSSEIETTLDTSMPENAACEEVTLNKTEIVFDRAGAAIFLNVTLHPVDTTDTVHFVSGDESVATVDEEGRITAVGVGETVITVSCGEAKATCQILCEFAGDLTDPTETSPDATTESTEATTNVSTPDPTTDGDGFDPASLKLNWAFTLVEDESIGDVTLSKGDEWIAYTDGDGKIPSNEITFSTTDPSVATIDEDGVVTAVGIGETMIIAEYRGHKVKCRILCV